MRELLFLAHRIPYPPDKGDKIRSWHILRHLSERFRIHLGCFIDDPRDWQHESRIADLAASHLCLGLNSLRGNLRALPGLLAGAPLSVGYYRDARMAAWVDGVLRDRKIDTVFVFSSQMAQYVMVPARRDLRRVIDFVDVDSDKWRQYAERKSWPASWVYGRESRTLLAFESSVADEFDAGIFVSSAEAALFRRLAPRAASRIASMPNGVDTAFFDPAHGGDSPFPQAVRPVVFTGAMDYWANADAVAWFADEALPEIRRRVPDAVFYIVGSNPAPGVRALGSRDGIVVTGRVPDVRPYLAHAAVVVAPLRIARGIQNKVLEGMAMARPVIVTPEALEGIPARPSEHVILAADVAALVQGVAGVLDSGDSAAAVDSRNLGLRARDFVTVEFGWTASLGTLDTLLDGGKPVHTPS